MVVMVVTSSRFPRTLPPTTQKHIFPNHQYRPSSDVGMPSRYSTANVSGTYPPLDTSQTILSSSQESCEMAAGAAAGALAVVLLAAIGHPRVSGTPYDVLRKVSPKLSAASSAARGARAGLPAAWCARGPAWTGRPPARIPVRAEEVEGPRTRPSASALSGAPPPAWGGQPRRVPAPRGSRGSPAPA